MAYTEMEKKISEEIRLRFGMLEDIYSLHKNVKKDYFSSNLINTIIFQ